MMMKLTFDCSLAEKARILELTWVAVNHEPYDVGLFNRIPQVMPDGTLRFSPDLAWIERDLSGTLRVALRALTIPKGLRMTAQVPPQCSRIAPGASHREVTRLALPVIEMHPYKRAVLAGATPGEITADVPLHAARLSFTLGAFAVVGDVHLSSEHPAFPEVWSPTPRAIAGQDLFVRDFDLARPIDVLGYRVTPWPCAR